MRPKILFLILSLCFFIPDCRPSKVAPEYTWDVYQGKSCNCEDATKEYKIVCVKTQPGREPAVVESSRCAHEVKPFVVADPCPEECAHTWVVTPFTACSRICGGGLQTRTVKCGNPKHPDYEAKDHFRCYSSMVPKPLSERNCAEIDCPPVYITSTWSLECHALSSTTHCGIGYNVRSLGCEQTLANGTIVRSISCEGKDKPNVFRDCYKPCPGLQELEIVLTPENRVLDAPGQFFVKSGQALSLMCNLTCSVPPQIERYLAWTLNGQKAVVNFDQILNSTRKLNIEAFDKEIHAGEYKCFLNIPINCVEIQLNQSVCNCKDEMKINLIHVEETEKDSKQPDSSNISQDSIKNSSDSFVEENADCYRNNCSIKWLTTDWPSECDLAVPLSEDDTSHNLNRERNSKDCIKGQTRFVWCGVPNKFQMVVEDSSKCNPKGRPSSVRECYVRC